MDVCVKPPYSVGNGVEKYQHRGLAQQSLFAASLYFVAASRQRYLSSLQGSCQWKFTKHWQQKGKLLH